MGVLSPWAFCHTWAKCYLGILTLGNLSYLGILSSWAFQHTIHYKFPQNCIFYLDISYLLWICWYSKGLVNVGSSNSLWPHRLKQWSSTKTSLANFCWYSNAILVTIITASGSSPLTWKIGELTTLAKSELYLEDFPRSLGVVKPTYFKRNNLFLFYSIYTSVSAK